MIASAMIAGMLHCVSSLRKYGPVVQISCGMTVKMYSVALSVDAVNWPPLTSLFILWRAPLQLATPQIKTVYVKK